MSMDVRFPIGGGVTVILTWDAAAVVALCDQMQANLSRSAEPLLEQVGRITRRSYGETFRAGGRPPWQALAPSTLERKAALIKGGVLPPRTATGRVPRRLLQRDQSSPSGAAGYGSWSILIMSGGLRDSYAVKGARGNVCDVTAHRAFFGSQYTIERTLPPKKPVMPYHITTKKGMAARAKGGSMTVRIPIARIHEEGAPNAHIPARPIVHGEGGGANLQPDDLEQIQQAAVVWFTEGLTSAI